MLKKSDPLRHCFGMTERVALLCIRCNEPEGRAFAQRTLHAEAEAVLLEDGLGDGKPQAGALLARIGAGAVIPVKDIGRSSAQMPGPWSSISTRTPSAP